MEVIVRTDDFEGVPLHTFTWRAKPAWLESEIVKVLGYAAPNLDGDPNALHGEDYELVHGEDARVLLEHCDITDGPEGGRPVMVLYETGLALVCAGVHGIGTKLRVMLMTDAAAGIQEALGMDAFTREVDVVLRERELDLRAHKVDALVSVLETMRGQAILDQDKFATCMAIVAEIATGHRVRVPGWRRSVDQAMGPDELAERLNVPRTWAFHALERVRAKHTNL